MNHATPILARLRNVFGQRRLLAVSATANDAREHLKMFRAGRLRFAQIIRDGTAEGIMNA